MTLWTAADAATATGGWATSDWAVTGISIDTRDIAPGDLFVALKDVRDGHDFVAQALEKGAGAALVSRIPDGVAPDAPLLLVDDVLPALERLGAAGRARTQAQVIGITGSVGKTSTKEMLRVALARQGKVHAAEKSFNNHWGVPLTLARMPADTDFAIIEIGMNHPGEIAPLSRLARPTLALITTVAEVHLFSFDNLDGIAREKAAIFDGLEPNGKALIHGDLPVTSILAEAATAAGASPQQFGTQPGQFCQINKVTIGNDTTVVSAQIAETPVLFKIMVPGRHLVMNALACLGVVALLDLDIALAAQDLASWSPPDGRGTRLRIGLDQTDPNINFELINDAFNANPTSTAAALEVLAAALPTDNVGRIHKGRRIAILGDMLELGSDESAMHLALADLPDLQSLDQIHCVGPLMRGLYDILPEEQRGLWVLTAAELAPKLHGLIDAGDVLLIKGSKGIKVSTLVDATRKLGHPLPTQSEG